MIVKAGWAAFNLDLTGKENAVLMSQGFIGADVRANRLFSIAPNRVTVSTHEFGKRDVAASLITLPTGWTLSPEKAVLSSDGRWIIANPEIRDRPGTLAVIDVAKRQVVHSQSMRWMITSLALSADGKRLLVGSSNRAIYEFDFLKMTAGE
jgi:MinD-like ATPase involved in chromosome partitioning or flagellar assembly